MGVVVGLAALAAMLRRMPQPPPKSSSSNSRFRAQQTASRLAPVPDSVNSHSVNNHQSARQETLQRRIEDAPVSCKSGTGVGTTGMARENKPRQASTSVRKRISHNRWKQAGLPWSIPPTPLGRNDLPCSVFQCRASAIVLNGLAPLGRCCIVLITVSSQTIHRGRLVRGAR